MHKPIVIPLAIAGGIDIVETQVIANGSPGTRAMVLPSRRHRLHSLPDLQHVPKPARYTEDNVVVQCRK